MPDQIIFDDVPACEIAIVRQYSQRIRSQELYDALQHFSQLDRDQFAMRINHIPSKYFRVQLYSACHKRWPGTRVVQEGDTLVVIPPQHGSA
jgi:hypothetical protein